MVTKPRKKRKGFTRSQKEWEESIATHLGKFIDKLTPQQLIDFLAYGIAAYYGQEAVRKQGVEDLNARVGGSAMAIISLKLATSMNLPAGVAGTIGLGGIGLCAVVPDIWGIVDPRDVWSDAMKKLSDVFLKQAGIVVTEP